MGGGGVRMTYEMERVCFAKTARVAVSFVFDLVCKLRVARVCKLWLPGNPRKVEPNTRLWRTESSALTLFSAAANSSFAVTWSTKPLFPANTLFSRWKNMSCSVFHTFQRKFLLKITPDTCWEKIIQVMKWYLTRVNQIRFFFEKFNLERQSSLFTNMQSNLTYLNLYENILKLT